jgi:hypothetical protein
MSNTAPTTAKLSATQLGAADRLTKGFPTPDAIEGGQSKRSKTRRHTKPPEAPRSKRLRRAAGASTKQDLVLQMLGRKPDLRLPPFS